MKRVWILSESVNFCFLKHFLKNIFISLFPNFMLFICRDYARITPHNVFESGDCLEMSKKFLTKQFFNFCKLFWYFFVFVFFQKIFWRKFSVNYRTKDLKFFNFFVVVENFKEDLKTTELKNKSITKQSTQQMFQFIQFKTE